MPAGAALGPPPRPPRFKKGWKQAYGRGWATGQSWQRRWPLRDALDPSGPGCWCCSVAGIMALTSFQCR